MKLLCKYHINSLKIIILTSHYYSSGQTVSERLDQDMRIIMCTRERKYP